MATSYYSTGTITLTNGSAVVTGTGTAWSTALIASGNIFVQASGNPLPIATVDSDTQITAELEWTGETGTYGYQIQLDQGLSNSAQNATNLTYLLSELRQGTLFKYDAAGTFEDRDLFDGRPKGYSYLVFSDDTADLFVKASNINGDWAGPFGYGIGPQGEQGPIGTLNPMGTYSAGAVYAANDNVLYNGSSWVALQATTGNAPPTLPMTENAYWSLLAVKGQDGTGIGDVVGPASSSNNGRLAFDGTTGKLIKEMPITAAEAVFDNSIAQLGGDPVTAQGAIDEIATVLANGLDAFGRNDAVFALELSDLKGVRLGMVGGVADPFDDETGVATKTNASYDPASDSYSPENGPVSGVPSVTVSLTQTTTHGALTFRNVIAAAAVSAGGNYVRVKIDGPASGAVKAWNNVFIGNAAASGDSFDFDGSRVRLTFSGSNSVSPPLAGSVWSDWIALVVDETRPLVVAMDSADSNNVKYKDSLGGNFSTYYKGGADAGTIDATGYTALPGNIISVSEVQVAAAIPKLDMTLVSTSYVSSSVPSVARVAVQVIGSQPFMVNDDLMIRVSRDGGASWVIASLSESIIFGGVKVYEDAAVDMSVQPSGSEIKWMLETLNGTEVVVSGVVVQWR